MKDPNGWIKSADRLPEFNTSVLVFIPEEDHHITSGMWDVSKKWVLLDEYRIPQSEVTYWMPFPREPLDTSFKKCNYIGHTTDDIIRNLQKDNFTLKDAIRKFVWHWDSYFNNKIVGNPPDLNDLRKVIEPTGIPPPQPPE
jgi:hypothetical protein